MPKLNKDMLESFIDRVEGYSEVKATNLRKNLSESREVDLGQVAFDIAWQFAIILSRQEHPQVEEEPSQHIH